MIPPIAKFTIGLNSVLASIVIIDVINEFKRNRREWARMYIQAICQTLTSMGPHYLVNIYRWVKTAIWDAPMRLFLDIELELQSIQRSEEREA